MRCMWLCCVALALTFTLHAEKKVYNEVAAETVTLSGKLYATPDAVKGLLGTDLGGHYMVLQVTVNPKGDKPLNVQSTDFQIFCEGDGDRTQPQSPAEARPINLASGSAVSCPSDCQCGASFSN